MTVPFALLTSRPFISWLSCLATEAPMSFVITGVEAGQLVQRSLWVAGFEPGGHLALFLLLGPGVQPGRFWKDEETSRDAGVSEAVAGNSNILPSFYLHEKTHVSFAVSLPPPCSLLHAKEESALSAPHRSSW